MRAPTPGEGGAAPSRSDAGSTASRTAMLTSFECNICLDAVVSPVVTFCGHLYCWPCIYQWMAAHTECPVCKAGISEDNVIPVYSRGADAKDPRLAQPSQDGGLHTNSDEGGIPARPRGQRLDPNLMHRRRPRQDAGGYGPSAAHGIFPGLFGDQNLFGVQMSPTHHADGTPLNAIELRQQMQQAFLSRLLLIVGSLVLLCLIAF